MERNRKWFSLNSKHPETRKPNGSIYSEIPKLNSRKVTTMEDEIYVAKYLLCLVKLAFAYSKRGREPGFANSVGINVKRWSVYWSPNLVLSPIHVVNRGSLGIETRTWQWIFASLRDRVCPWVERDRKINRIGVFVLINPILWLQMPRFMPKPRSQTLDNDKQRIQGQDWG